jgi:enoyl-CoA hydratase
MSYELPPEITLESDGAVRVLTINRPQKMNAIDPPLYRALCGVWQQIEHDREARAVVLTGAGKAFCSGGDISRWPDYVSNIQARRQIMRYAKRLVDEMVSFHLPVVCAINGPAVGLGASIALLCDIVLISEDAYIADNHVPAGLVGGEGGPMVWPHLMSLLHAKELLLTGRRIEPEEAVSRGLANRVAPGARLMDDALSLARELASLPPQAVQDTKRAMNLYLQQDARAVLEYSVAAELHSFEFADVSSAADSFLEPPAG